MERRMWLAWAAATSFACLSMTGYAQQDSGRPSANQAAIAPGSVSGVVRDPSGALIEGAHVELTVEGTATRHVAKTNRAGIYLFPGLAVGRCDVTVQVAGFAPATVRGVVVRPGEAAQADVMLHLARVNTEIEVSVAAPGVADAQRQFVNPVDRDTAQNAAQLLTDIPGVSLRQNGDLASIPELHGLGDERTRIAVNGMTVSSSCPNHMNPPLSYIAPSAASRVTVMAGITPVSTGGDSLGGTIAIDAPAPVFGEPGDPVHEDGSVASFYRSNGQNAGGAANVWIAGRNAGIGYSGYWTTAEDYTDGSGRRITSTYAQSTDHMLTLAGQWGANHLELEAGLHHVPYQGFVNQQMDMVRNYALSLNLHERRSMGTGTLDGRLFWQSTSHTMNLGHDKAAFPMPMTMPMNDHGTDTGYALAYIRPLSARHTLSIGNELHRFVLHDVWPPVAGNAPMMGPETFVNINNGRRMRLGTFAEVASRWNSQWSTDVGVRNDTVWSNSGPVHGYSAMYAMDATAFNAAKRARTDIDWGVTAMAHYAPGRVSEFSLGYARKTRAPNLYERYTWSTNPMVASMIGWFGDGNAYVGNLALQPEIAQTVSGTLTLHDPDGQAWEVTATPWLTHVAGYIDVDALAPATSGMSSSAELRFANHTAGIYGGDVAAHSRLWASDRLGNGQMSATGGWLHGERLDTYTGLYEMMPVYLRMHLDDGMRTWSAGVDAEAVDRKSNVDPHRLEPRTPGFALFGLHATWQGEHVQMGAAIRNLLNREYALPLGGVDVDESLAGMAMGPLPAVPGPGRSMDLNLKLQF